MIDSSTVIPDERSCYDFPKLMINEKNGCIILATGIAEMEKIMGTIVREASGSAAAPIGSTGPYYSIKSFKDYEGSVVLKNKKEEEDYEM